MTAIHAYAAHGADTPLVPFTVERREPRPDDVELDVLFCGVCHTDIHVARNDWGTATYPVVPGHEIVGRVTRVGEGVRRFTVGQLVGVGCMVDSCRACGPCHRDLEQYCASGATLTYGSKDRHDGSRTLGGYSEKLVVSERFVLVVPESLDPAGTAPLLCAGITSYSPLKRFGAGPGKKVAVVGLGGIGHLALKFAHAMGAEVTLFSRSPGKEADALRLGAHQVVMSTDEQAMRRVADTFDVIVDTVPYVHDVNPYLSTLAVQGALVLVGYLGPIEEKVNAAAIVRRGRTLAGSLIGGLAETQEMLDFCGQHQLVSDVEVIDIQDINAAYERVLKSDVKYRFAIDLASLKR